jgi:hypothetical protein
MTPPQSQFGELKHVALRDLWPHEAMSFTPWLAEHLADLGKALGLDLELTAREAPVGSFSLDLLAHDLGRNRIVIIENQLEPTNHDHLGKLLTYAAGHDASIVIWVAQDFRDEHRQTLDWLNQHTDTNIEFFGVVVEVLRIDDSRPAFNFKLVAFPNEWRKQNVGEPVGQLSLRGEAYRTFFQPLIDDLRTKHHFTNARIAQPQSWYAFASGVNGCAYSACFALGHRARVELYLDRPNADVNKHVFDELYTQRDAIEAAFSESLSWERLDDRKASRVAVYRAGSIEDAAATLEEIRRWMIEHLLRMKSIFGPRLTHLA